MKLFQQQLAFNKDIDFCETVEFPVPPVADDKILSFLIDKATDIFGEQDYTTLNFQIGTLANHRISLFTV